MTVNKARHYLSYLSMTEELKRCQTHAQKIQKNQNIVFVGLGGSSLGVRAICRFLDFDQITVVDNLDEASLKELGKKGSTHWIIASKSGTTMETLGILNHLLQRAESVDPSAVTVMTSQMESPLGKWAKENKVEVLMIPEIVGGRFSVYSPIGFLPLAVAGFNPKEIADTIQDFAENSKSLDEFYHFFKTCCEEKMVLLPIWSYGSRVHDAALWFQQLWSESLGKPLPMDSMTVPVPMVCRGASDQHSLLQQFVEQPQEKAHFFMKEETLSERALQEDLLFPDRRLRGHSLSDVLSIEADSCQKALEEVGARTHRRTFSRSIGSLLQFFTDAMIAVDMIARDLRVNAFDQPGVERCKQLIHQALTSERPHQ